jgi:hypothetical protein
MDTLNILFFYMWIVKFTFNILQVKWSCMTETRQSFTNI